MSELEQLDYGTRFIEFLRNFRDETGRFKYIDRVRRMINFNQHSLIIDYGDLYKYDTELAEAVIDDPDRFLKEAGEAIREVVKLEDPEYAVRVRKFVPRIIGLYETVKIRDIKSQYIGKMVQIEGIITRMLPVKSKLVKARFLHTKCGAEFDWPEGDEEITSDVLEKPTYCPVCGESAGRFILVKEKSVYVDYQKIVVQERPEDVPGGQMPRSIEVRLTDDLVDVARPGDRVSIVGVVRLDQPSSKASALFDLYIDANSIKVSEKALEEVSITREDEEKIRELARDPWIKEKIVASIAPGIYGNWDLKEAIALLLFGGVPKVRPEGIRVRGDIHVLFVGDPGMAKSQLLQAAARIAPRAVLTSGKGATAAGLTAAVLRDKQTGEFYLEAGALVLADGGVAIIDEFDKMNSNDRSAIHEAMEQQVISVSKAGIVARLNARASVLAAGNPKMGYYDPRRPFIENVNLPPPIISRFDLIFVLRDVPNLRRDYEMASYILESHRNTERFKPEIDLDLLRKYIIYARRYVRPRLSKAAIEMLRDFYIELRGSVAAAMQNSEEASKDLVPIPVTARQLEALVRLAEANAKIALREEVTEEDAAEAIRLTLSFLTSVGFDVESGVIDVGTIITGATFSTRKLMGAIIDFVKEKQEGRRCVREEEIIEEFKRKGVSEAKVKEAIEKLHSRGLIYEPRGKEGCYRVV
ncbi:minichromosome maintenance protein MCM [Stetteria hydrogenophila]